MFSMRASPSDEPSANVMDAGSLPSTCPRTGLARRSSRTSLPAQAAASARRQPLRQRPRRQRPPARRIHAWTCRGSCRYSWRRRQLCWKWDAKRLKPRHRKRCRQMPDQKSRRNHCPARHRRQRCRRPSGVEWHLVRHHLLEGSACSSCLARSYVLYPLFDSPPVVNTKT